MALEVRNFESLLNDLRDAFSRKQLLQHFHIYQGHVIRLYELEAALKDADRTTGSRIWGEFSELHRRHAVAFNGAVFHEFYFEGLTADKTVISESVSELITRDFGSVKVWEEELRAMAEIGDWVLLTYSHPEKKLQQWVVTENHVGVPVHQTILLALDCAEHAWIVDYAGHIEDYLDVYIKHINWNRVNLRLKLMAKK